MNKEISGYNLYWVSCSEVLNMLPLVIYEGKGCEIGNLQQSFFSLYEKRYYKESIAMEYLW